jgi:thioester reductase-like protein
MTTTPEHATPPDRGAVLLTGATGFVGQEILARYLERSDRPVYALVRAEDDEAAAERLQSTLRLLYDDAVPDSRRLTALAGDLETEGLGLSQTRGDELAERVTQVVHSAASISFDLPLPEARRINVVGTRRVLDFADRCRDSGAGLRGLVHVSTAYVAGDHKGEFREDQLEVGQEFRNTYERTKFEAEHLVRGTSPRLPVTIVRPSIVVGERSSGWTSSFNVLYPPLKAFARGARPALPARSSTPVDVVPVDYVADAVFELAEEPDTDLGVYHLVAGDRATTVDRLRDRAARLLRRRPPRIVSPELYRRLLHPMLVRFTGERTRRALRRTETLFPYFSMRVRFDDRRARARLGKAGLRAPALESYFDRLLGFAVRTRWGRNLPSRRQASLRAPGA